MRLATFNVNSVRRRVGHLKRFLERHSPDLVFLQETKCRTEELPALEFEGTGYRVHAVGQQGGRNGVPVLGRVPFEVVGEALGGDPEDAHARFVEVSADGGGLRIAGIYLPNGNSGGEEGFAYKLRWMERLRDWTRERLDRFEPCAVLGDFNVCPTDQDFPPGGMSPDDALVRPESRARFRALLHLGMTDVLRALHPEDAPYTYWDYGPAFESNRGLRIDHILLSPQAADRLAAADIDKAPRGWEKPSDHVPVWADLRIGA